jgi:hypothetical protein
MAFSNGCNLLLYKELLTLTEAGCTAFETGSLIAFHIVATLLGYLLFQLYVAIDEGEKYSGKSLPVILKNYDFLKGKAQKPSPSWSSRVPALASSLSLSSSTSLSRFLNISEQNHRRCLPVSNFVEDSGHIPN